MLPAAGADARGAPGDGGPCIAAAAAQLPPGAASPPLLAFSNYRYGFRFMPAELALLERMFAASGGATPARADLHRLAAALSSSPARLQEPPHPVSDRQIKVRPRARCGCGQERRGGWCRVARRSVASRHAPTNAVRLQPLEAPGGSPWRKMLLYSRSSPSVRS